MAFELPPKALIPMIPQLRTLFRQGEITMDKFLPVGTRECRRVLRDVVLCGLEWRIKSSDLKNCIKSIDFDPVRPTFFIELVDGAQIPKIYVVVPSDGINGFAIDSGKFADGPAFCETFDIAVTGDLVEDSRRVYKSPIELLRDLSQRIMELSSPRTTTIVKSEMNDIYNSSEELSESPSPSYATKLRSPKKHQKSKTSALRLFKRSFWTVLTIFQLSIRLSSYD